MWQQALASQFFYTVLLLKDLHVLYMQNPDLDLPVEIYYIIHVDSTDAHVRQFSDVPR